MKTKKLNDIKFDIGKFNFNIFVNEKVDYSTYETRATPTIYYTMIGSTRYDYSLDALESAIRAINVYNGWSVLWVEEWDDKYKIPAIIALIHSELSEALEAFRNRDIENFKEEIADTVIRILDMTKGIPGMDIGYEIQKKLEINKTRGFRHGNKKM